MQHRAPAAFAALSLALLIGPAVAQQGWYGPVLVSEPPDTPQDMGQGLAVDPSGNYTVVWSESLDFSDNVWLRRMRFDGVPLDAPVKVNATDTYNRYPEIGSDEAGNAVLAWGETSDFQTWALRVQRYDAAGVARGPTTVVKQAVESSPRLSVNASGLYLLSWYESGTRRARVFGADGTPAAAEFVVDPVLGDAQLVLTPQGKIMAGRREGDGFLLQCLSSSGAAVSPATTFGIEGEPHYGDPYGDFTVAPDGSAILTWNEVEIAQGVVHKIINLSRVAPDCVTQQWHTEALRAVVYGNFYQSRVAVSRDADEIGLSWVFDDGSGEGHGYSSFFQKFDAQGQALGEPHPLASGYTILGAPHMAIVATGDVVAAWPQYDFSTGTSFDVYAAGTGYIADDGNRDLAVTLSASSGTVNFGEPIAFTVDVRNRTVFAADGVRAQVSLPADFAIDSASGNGWQCAIDVATASCALGHALNGAAPAITIAARAGAGGAYEAVATVASAAPDHVLDNNTATAPVIVVPPSAELEMNVFHNYSVTLGATMPVTGVVTNWESNVDATGVFVEFTFEPALRFESADNPDWSCEATAQGARCQHAGGLPDFRAIELHIVVRAVAEPGEYVISGVAGADQADPNPANNRHDVPVRIESPPYDLKLSAFGADPAVVSPGETTVVTATVLNQTAATYASNFELVFSPPKDFTIQSISAPGWQCVDVYCTYGGTLRQHEVATVQITLVAPYVVGKYPMSAFVRQEYWRPEPTPADNEASGQVEVAVCGISDASSIPDPAPHFKYNPGGVHVGVCGKKLHVK